MAYGQQIAAQLGRMSREVPEILAVVGLNESRQNTADTIAALGREGLPVVAATLSADTLINASQMYFQTSPQNIREASVAANFAQHLIDDQNQPLQRRVRIYFSDDIGDTYSQNLAADMKARFAGNGFAVESVAFTPSGNRPGAGAADRVLNDPAVAGRDSCGFGGVVVYAARPLPDFQAFISGIGDGCRDTPPFVLAGDDVSRYVADRGISEDNRSVPFRYLSFAVAPEQADAVQPEAADFYQALNTLFPYEGTNRGRSLDGHAAMTFDAAYTAVLAAGHLRRNDIALTGGHLWPSLLGMTDRNGAQRAYQGVTGSIDFGGTVARRVPINKPIALILFRDGAPQPAETIICAEPGESSPQWCPFDE